MCDRLLLPGASNTANAGSRGACLVVPSVPLPTMPRLGVPTALFPTARSVRFPPAGPSLRVPIGAPTALVVVIIVIVSSWRQRRWRQRSGWRQRGWRQRSGRTCRWLPGPRLYGWRQSGWRDRSACIAGLSTFIAGLLDVPDILEVFPEAHVLLLIPPAVQEILRELLLRADELPLPFAGQYRPSSQGVPARDTTLTRPCIYVLAHLDGICPQTLAQAISHERQAKLTRQYESHHGHCPSNGHGAIKLRH